jgi:hypothetical protein
MQGQGAEGEGVVLALMVQPMMPQKKNPAEAGLGNVSLTLVQADTDSVS